MDIPDLQFDIAHVRPERRDTYDQARQLVHSGLLHEKWLVLNATKRLKEAEALANSIAIMRERAVKHRQTIGLYFPIGILLLGLDAMTFFKSWDKNYQQQKPIPHVIVVPSEKPHFQIAQILQTGVASERMILVVHNPKLAGSLNDFDEQQEQRMSALVEELDRAVRRGTINDCRVIRPRPFGIMTCTDSAWKICHNYMRIFHAKA